MGIQINGLTDIISASDGSLTVSGADLSNLTQLNVTGVATFQGNVSIAGTLTYDDVTNVDSLGIVTARKGIRITNNTAAGAAGRAVSFQFSDNVANSINISMISAQTIFSQNGVESMRIDASGRVGIGSTTPTSKLDVAGDVKVIGVVTATSFSGSGANLTGLPAGFSELDGMLFG